MMPNDGQANGQINKKTARHNYVAALRTRPRGAFAVETLEPRTLLSGNGGDVQNLPMVDPTGIAQVSGVPPVSGSVLPGVPSNVGASNNLGDKVTVIWLAATNATAYEVFRSQTNDTSTAVQINATDIPGLSYDDTTATPGVSYFYWVKAKNTSGLSSFSTDAPGIRIAVPSAPTLGSVTADSTSQVSLQWTDTSNASDPTSFFLIDRATDAAFTQNLVTLQTGLAGFYNDVHLNAGTQYFYRIYAHNPAGNSTFTTTSITTKAQAAGNVIAWGETNVETNVPAGLTNVIAVTGGLLHSVALKSDTTVVAWGDDSQHQTDVPAGLTGVIAISAGANHTLALKSNGTVVAWGSNSSGQSTVPGGLVNVIAIAAGSDYSLALLSDGTVTAWGDTGNATGGAATVPGGLVNVAAIAAGGSVSLALKQDGTVVAWGDSGNTTNGAATVPGGLIHVVSVAEGTNFSLALKQDGTLVAWGDNTSHQVDGGNGLTGISAIAAAGLHGLAIKSDLTVIAWGDNTHNQTAVTAGVTNVTSIAGGTNDSLAVATPPAPPAAFATADIFGSVTVAWNAASGASAYEVWRSTTNNSSTAIKISVADVTGTTYSDSGGTADTGYFYFIKAKDLGGTSGFGTSGEGVSLGNNGRFVAHIYEDLLAREPDAPGLLFWTDGFTAGTKTTSDLASGFLDSVEYRTDLINGLYATILHRGVDSTGLTGWLNFFAGGGTYEQIKANIYGSAEFFTNEGNDIPTLLDAYYLAFLDRHAEPAGLTYWEAKLAGGQTHAQVALGIESGSLEGAQTIVTNTYETYLHRPPEPAGLNYWVAMLQAGKSQLDITFGFLTSPEYFMRA